MQLSHLSRREFVELAGIGSTSAVLAAYGRPTPAAAAGSTVSAQPAAAGTRFVSRLQVEPITTYDVTRLNHILTAELADFSDYPATYPPARYPVKLYRVTYPSVIPEQNNRPTITSGLVAVPDNGESKLPVISYQHGTVFSKTEAPSNPDESMETRLMLAQFAGQGYMMIAADYFGKATSVEDDSYTVKRSTQQACIDMLFAAQAVADDRKLEMGQLFLSGWSQGGWATPVFLEKLESAGIPVTAAAYASAPVDLYATVNRWMHAPTKNDAIYLPGVFILQLFAYETYYRMPGLANYAIKPQYQEAARKFYLDELTMEEAERDLPTLVVDLLTDDFMASSNSTTMPYWQIVQDNHAYRFRSSTPQFTYWGGSDEVTPPYIAQMPVAYQQIMGGAPVTAVATGDKANHRGNFVSAVADQKKRFDALLK